MADSRGRGTSPGGPRCPACSALALEGARFCRACGSSLSKVCRKCSNPLDVNARFCRRCGEPVLAGAAPGPSAVRSEAPRSVQRRKIPRSVAVPGAALMLLIVGGFAWVLFLRGDGKPDNGGEFEGEPLESAVTVLEPPAEGAVDSVNGLPLRAGVRLDHPGGASAQIPGGAALYGDVMDLRRVQLADDPWWDHGGFGWEFVSFVGVPIAEPATVDLPAGGPGTSVIVRTVAGFWVELPSEAVTLKDGRPGERVTVSNVPAPWVFALAAPKAGAPALTGEEQDDLRIEQLYWTDRAAWEGEIDAWLETDPMARTFSEARYASQQPPADPWREYERVRAQMRFTLKMFGAARGGLDDPISLFGGASNPTGEELSPDELWAGGVERLFVVKQNWLAFRSTIDLQSVDANRQVAVYFVDEWIETAMHDYTPWGIDLVKALLDAEQLRDLDIRVLKPYGELKWVDIVIKSEEMPADIESFVRDELAHGKYPIGGTPTVQRTLRFYSVRAMERLAIVDWLKQNVDWIVRWLPVALAATGLIPGAVGLSLAFAAADQILDWVNGWYTAGNEHPYAYMVMEGASAGGIGGTSFVLDMYEESVLMKEAGRGMLPAHGLTIAQFAYSVGMFAAIRGTDYYLFKSIREAAEGTRGYCAGRCDSISGGIPPVMLHVRGTGTLVQPEGAYPTGIERLMSFRLKTGDADFHGTWLSGGRSASQSTSGLPFEHYGSSNWPVGVAATQPQYQSIRVTIPKASIPPEVWGDRPRDAPLSEFGARLVLRGPNGEVATFSLTEDAKKIPGDKTENFYTNVLLIAPGERSLSAEQLAWFDDGLEPGADQQQTFQSNAALTLKLTGEVEFDDPRAEPLPVTVQLEKAPRRIALLDGDELMPGTSVARVHFGTAAATADIDGVYQIVSWQMTGGSAEIVRIYNEDRLYPFGRMCESGGTCTFDVQTTPARGSEPERRQALVCGPDADGTGSRYCRGVADSKPYEPSGGLLPPTSHDNFFLLTGPILTGSDHSGSHGNPGEPAVINHWNEIRAEFKDGKVTATMTTNQLIWEVVNGQVANLRIVSLTVLFEAVKQK
ncbi:MAG: zinc ribbon domain-containing protein [Dehalococcoidia bacterium]|nr:zinc ribbon domain-containing protein [Dehalococcoidia bacterium]